MFNEIVNNTSGPKTEHCVHIQLYRFQNCMSYIFNELSDLQINLRGSYKDILAMIKDILTEWTLMCND